MKELLFQFFMFPRRIRFRWRNRGRLKVLDSLAKTLRTRCDESARSNWVHYRQLYNVGLFVVLADRDIFGFNESMFFARSEWHRQFHARGLAVLLYELSEDLPQLLGKEYREALKELGIGEIWFKELNAIGKKLSTFRNKNKDFLYEVRNYVGAHRHQDAVMQLDAMMKIDTLDIYKIAVELNEPINELVSFYGLLLKYMHNTIVKIRYIGKKLDREATETKSDDTAQ